MTLLSFLSFQYRLAVENKIFSIITDKYLIIQILSDINIFFIICKDEIILILCHDGVIPYEIKHSKNESLSIVFILGTQSVHPMRVHNQPPVTSGSRVTGWENFVN